MCQFTSMRRGTALSAGTMPWCLTCRVTLDVAFLPFPFQSGECTQSRKDFRLKLPGKYTQEQLSGWCPAWERGAVPLCFEDTSARKWRAQN